jgi:hypothetical protein
MPEPFAGLRKTYTFTYNTTTSSSVVRLNTGEANFYGDANNELVINFVPNAAVPSLGDPWPFPDLFFSESWLVFV